MFRDLKEYQEIYNLYQNNVYLSEEQREFAKAINEAGLTDEELYYFSENTDEVINYLIETEVLDEGKAKAIKGVFKLGGMVKGLSKTKLPTKGYNLSNIGGFKGFKGAPLKGISSKLTNPFKNLKTPKLKGKKDISKTVKGAKDGIKKKLSDAGVKTPVKTALTAGGVGALIGGAIQTGKNKAQVQATQAELAAIKRELEKIKKEKDDAIDKKVDKLKAKNKDFQAMKKGKMTKQEFVDKYPKSITAQRQNKLRDHTEWDAYDMVLEYLFSTEQVASLEEANYVMMEMDQQTIGSIVNEVSEFLEEGIGSVRILPALGKIALGAAAVKGISSYLGKKSGESSIKGSQPMKGGEKGGDPIKDLIPNLKKNKEATEKAIEKM